LLLQEVAPSVTSGGGADPAVLGVSDGCRCKAGFADHVLRARDVAVMPEMVSWGWCR
jgi:hypothetical protein